MIRSMGQIVCLVVGHKLREKLSCMICDRCRIVLEVR